MFYACVDSQDRSNVEELTNGDVDMTERDARIIIRRFFANDEPEGDEAAFEEACHFLMEVIGDMKVAEALGGYYYGKRRYDLALKYYTLAAENGTTYAWIGLGYIWYYGRLGVRDYEKAYHSFAKAIELLTGRSIECDTFWTLDKKVKLHNKNEYDQYINAAYKLADMYRYGLYVEESWEHFAYLIRQLYDMMCSRKNEMIRFDDLMPEISLRMADVLLAEQASDVEGKQVKGIGRKKKEALDILLQAKDAMALRLDFYQFFGNFSVMKSIVRKIYSLTEFVPEKAELYALYYVLQTPCRVSFLCDETRHEVFSEREGGEIVVCLDEIWYHTIDDFMMKGKIDGRSIPDASFNCHDFRLL